MSWQLVGLCSLPQDWVPGIFLQGAPVEALWIHTLVPYTGGVSDVVCWGWGAGIFGVRLSRTLALRCPVVVSCNSTSILFRSIAPLSSLGLPHIFLAVLRRGGPRPFYVCIWYQSRPKLAWNLCLCLCVSIVLGIFLPAHIRKVWGAPSVRPVIWSKLAPDHILTSQFWHRCIRSIACWVSHNFQWYLGGLSWAISWDILPC